MSVKLKEKGLNIPFYFFYRTDDVDKQIHHSTSTKALEYSNKIIDNEVVIAPQCINKYLLGLEMRRI